MVLQLEDSEAMLLLREDKGRVTGLNVRMACGRITNRIRACHDTKNDSLPPAAESASYFIGFKPKNDWIRLCVISRVYKSCVSVNINAPHMTVTSCDSTHCTATII